MKPRSFLKLAALALGTAFLLGMGSAARAQVPAAPPPASSEAGRIWNPLRPAADNRPLTLRILVLNYDPIVPGEGHKRLGEVFKWNTPERLALRYRAAMEDAAGGAIRYEIVEWRNLNEIYAQRGGFTYTVEEYVKNRRAGSGWREHIEADYPRLLRAQGVAEMVARGLADEVWIFSDHFFGLWEASMAGPGAFFINGGVYPEVPSARPFAFYGFNYERGVAEMMHDAAHRTESTLNRVYGTWKLANPVSNWDKFSANFSQSNGVAGVGTCHWPANAEHDYDYGNKRTVESWADAFLTYPQTDWTKKPVSRETWAQGKDDQADYMKWYFAHLPRAPGVNADGRQNNWFKYIWDFEDYDRDGKPLAPRACVIGKPRAAVGEDSAVFAVGFSSAAQIARGSITAQAVEVVGPGGKAQAAKLVGVSGEADARYLCAYFSAAPAGGKWHAADAGEYRVRLRGGVVRDLAGVPLAVAEIGTWRVLAAAETAQLVPGEAKLILVPGEVRRISLTEKTGAAAEPLPDLTYEAAWASADLPVAFFTAPGLIEAARPGQTTLRVSHAGRSVFIPVEVSAPLPTARIAGKELPAKANDPLTVKVAFRGGTGLAPDSLGFGDVLLLGPGGVFAFADAQPGTVAGAAGEKIVTYTIAAPERGWLAEGARGQLRLKAWQVHDSDGTFFPETDLGTVEIPPRTGASAPR